MSDPARRSIAASNPEHDEDGTQTSVNFQQREFGTFGTGLGQKVPVPALSCHHVIFSVERSETLSIVLGDRVYIYILIATMSLSMITAKNWNAFHHTSCSASEKSTIDDG